MDEMRSVDRFSKRIQHELRLLSFHYSLPFSLGNPNVSQIEITNACHYRCPICPHTMDMTRTIEYMSFSFFRKIVGKLYQSNEPIYLHVLGEPFMHPDLMNMIWYGKSRGYEIGLFTNGSLLTEENARNIIDVELDYLVISFEVVEDTFNQLRSGANFHEVYKNIMNFLKVRGPKRKPRVTISSITLPKDKGNFENRFWKSKVDRFIEKELHDWTGDIPKITQIAGRKRNTKKTCLLPWLKMSVLVDGKVVPCCLDYDGKYVLGNLGTESLKSIWNGEKMIKLRKALVEGKKGDIELCSKCTRGPEVKGILRNRLDLLYKIRSSAS